MSKLVQRIISCQGHDVVVGLDSNIGYMSITDRNLYPDEDSRSHRRDQGFDSMMIPMMTREDLLSLRDCISEILESSSPQEKLKEELVEYLEDRYQINNSTKNFIRNKIDNFSTLI